MECSNNTSAGTADYTDGEDVRTNLLKGQSSVKSETYESLESLVVHNKVKSMISRKRTVVVYGRGSDGTKGDFIVVRELLHEGYDVVWAVQNGNKPKEAFLEMEELLDSEGLGENLRVLHLDSNGIYPYIEEDLNFKVDGSVPYAMIHMGLAFDEKLSEDDPVNHYCDNVQGTISLIKLYKKLGMKKFILNCAYDLTTPKESPSFLSIHDSMMCVINVLDRDEFRIVTYSDVVGEIPYDYIDVDGEKREDGGIVLGNDNTCIINMVNSLEPDSDGIQRIDLNKEIYKNRLGYTTESNGFRNYVFGPDLADLHVALLDRDFDDTIPRDLYVGVNATTKEVLDTMSKGGSLEYKYVPEGEDKDEEKPKMTSNVPESLMIGEGFLTEVNQILF